MCEFYGSNGNGFGDIWWTDNPIYFSSIDIQTSQLMIFDTMKLGYDGNITLDEAPLTVTNSYKYLGHISFYR